MTTVKQKLEKKLSKWEKQFPELITNQMHLGTKDHPSIDLWNETSNLVGTVILHSWRKLKYLLNVWNTLESYDPYDPRMVYMNINSYLRQNDMGYYARLFEKEFKQQIWKMRHEN